MGLAIYFIAIFLLASCVSWAATMWVMVATSAITLTALAFGNWSQHMFVDPRNSRSNYALAYNCIDLPGNRRTFNDGYHIIHHSNARLHWSEMPAAFHNSLDKHGSEGAITFRGIDFMEVGLLVMTGRLHKLAETYYVHLGDADTAPTVDEMVAKFREWLVPVQMPQKIGKFGAKTD